ncbi:GlsB/YeaQ/YmgE family stress response membrane protein [Thermaurantiacus sp.]
MDYGILGWIVVGLVAGSIAKWIHPGRDPGGLVVTILIGIAGALLGGFLAGLAGLGAGGTLRNLALATGGAVLLLALYRWLTTRRS